MHYYKKGIIIILISVMALVAVIIAFISPISKYLIEKYDLQFSGREITMDWAYVNPFTGYINFNDVRIYELGSDSIFFSAKSLKLNFALLKLFTGNYEVSQLTIDQPRGIVIQNSSIFNFNDLIRKFSVKDASNAKREPVNVNILDIVIKRGQFYYSDILMPVNFFVKEFDLKSSGIRSDCDTVYSEFSFAQGEGTGRIEGNFAVNIANSDYRLSVQAHDFDMNIIGQYLRDLTNYGNFSAVLNADMKSAGNLKSVNDVTTSGVLSIKDFHFGKNIHDDYLSFDNLVVAIRELSPEKLVYEFDSISLLHPYFKYERYDSLDNLQTMFGRNGSNIKSAQAGQFNLVLEIADYVKAMTTNFFKSQYSIKRLAIYGGDIKYNDYSISEKFSVELNPLTIVADSIYKNRDRVYVSVVSGIKPYGKLIVDIGVNPEDSSDFDLKYALSGLPASMFNPYLISQTSFPLDRGTIEVHGNWVVRNSVINSRNHLVIIDPRIAQRHINKDLKWMPMRPMISVMRDKGNVVDYEIPITGHLKDSRFNVWDVIFDALNNIFVKPVSTPYIVQVRTSEREIEKSLSLTWETRQSTLNPQREKFVKKLADFLGDNPEASITILPQFYTLKEKEYIVYYEAKKRFLSQSHNNSGLSLSEADSMAIENMSVKDPLFINYLNTQVPDSTIFTVIEKCERLLDSGVLISRLSTLQLTRKNAFLAYFDNTAVQNRIHFDAAVNTIPYNGYSYYKISYNGEFPGDLVDSYNKMNELNNKKPRKKFNDKRSLNNAK